MDYPDLLQQFTAIVGDIATNDRRIFMTSEGALGIGSGSIECGDRLALISGLPAPMVLRPDDPFTPDWFKTEHRCVCSAFVLGCMDGSQFDATAVREVRLI